MTDEDDILSFIRMQQQEINIKISNDKFKKLNKRLKYHDIQDRLDKFMEQNDYNKRLIVMPGLRGVGKSTIIYQLYDYLVNKKNVDTDNILYLDVDELTSNFNTDISKVFNIFLEYYHSTIPVALNKKLYLLIDEAQYDKKWARFAKILYDKNINIFMIFTGSSALELENNTDATRRMKIERIYPMNFKEYLLLVHDIKTEDININDILLNCNEENVKKLIKYEKKVYKNFLKLDNDPDLELKRYIQQYSFPFAINNDKKDIFDDIQEVIRRIIKDDLVLFKEYNKVSSQTISQIITYLATKKAGKTKYSTIAQSAEISSNTVKEILKILELTQLIFSICAYGPGGKILKNAQEHFFITPNIKSSINYRIGRYTLNERKCYSLLVKNMVASNIFYHIKKTDDSIGLFYDSNKKGVDFIIKYSDSVIPIEVCIGKKTKSQLSSAAKKYKAKHSILISNRTKQVKYENNVLYIPLLLFALII